MTLPMILQAIGLFFCSLSAIILPLKTVFGKHSGTSVGFWVWFVDAVLLLALGFFNFVLALRFGGQLFTNPEFITFITSPL